MNTDKQKEEVPKLGDLPNFPKVKPLSEIENILYLIKKYVPEYDYGQGERYRNEDHDTILKYFQNAQPKELPKQLEEEKLEITCPDCNGTGTLTGEGVYPECCRNTLEDGSCCNNPIPERYPVPIECERCEASGKIEQLEEVNEDAIADCLNTILKSSFEVIDGAFRKTVIPKEAITNAFNEYFGVKETEPEF